MFSQVNCGSRVGWIVDLVKPVFSAELWFFMWLNELEKACDLCILSATKVASVGGFFPISHALVE